MQRNCTDWPHVETDMAAWREWAKEGPAPSLPLRKRPFLVRLYRAYDWYRFIGIGRVDSFIFAWELATR